jgi:hypothetical protein
MVFSVPSGCQHGHYITPDGTLTAKRKSGKDLEGSGPGLIVVLSWHSPGGSEEDQVNTPTALPLYRPRFEPSTSRIQAQGLTTKPSCSGKCSAPIHSFITTMLSVSQGRCRDTQKAHGHGIGSRDRHTEPPCREARKPHVAG